LTQLYGIVLALEPEACQDIFQPLHPLEKESPIPADLSELLEPDSYHLTRLHRAAFYGDTEMTKKILEKIRQNLTCENETDELVVKMTRSEYRFTPLYVAAARSNEEILCALLVFFREPLVAGVVSEKELTDLAGIIRCEISKVIESENDRMFKLILKAVKKELGQNYLISLLNECLTECKTKELFNAVAKVVVMSDDNNVKDYTDLYNLVFHNDSVRNTLKFVDAENLQGLLLLKGVEDFTKNFLETQFLSSAFQLMSNNLLQHFNEDQLKQFVQTITSKNNTKKVKSNYEYIIDSASLDNPAEMESQRSSFPGWTRDEIVFIDDPFNGTTTIYAERLVPRPSYWRDFIKSALTAHYGNLGFVSREDVHCIFDCLKRVGDNSAKQLLLHEEDNGFIMIPASQQIVQLMLAHLPQESQQEVKRQWKNDAPRMSTFFTWNSVESDDVGIARYSSDNIFRFYLNYGSEIHLNEFVNVATTVRNIGGELHSVWSCIFKTSDNETNEILKLVSEKMEILGRDAVQKLLLHEIDNVPFIIKAVSWGEDVDARLEILPKEIKEEIQQFMKQKAPEFIEQALRNLKAFFKTFNAQHYNKLNSFTFFLNYHNDISQLEQFVQNITSTADDGENTRSIWAELLTNECQNHKTDDIAKMDKFMKCLSEKLGSNAVKELVLHSDGEMRVIFYPALRGEEKMLETMLNYLSAKDRKKVQRQVDEFLDETFKNDEYNQYHFNLFF
jgi:hypothetical protein